jgi:hypothetical protein
MNIDMLTLGHIDGETRLRSDTLVIALDDTGHEEFRDEKFQVFGIGGCAFLVADYKEMIASPWEDLFRRSFPNLQRPVHSSTNLRNLESQQMLEINNFFRDGKFFRLAATVNSAAERNVSADYIEIISTSLLQRVASIAGRVKFRDIAVLVEASDRLDVRLINALSQWNISSNGILQNINIFRAPKTLSIPAIEVADVIVHAAGGYSRKLLQGSKVTPKNFEAIFRPSDSTLVSYINIDRTDPV